jgi:arginine utilization regulatory protein
MRELSLAEKVFGSLLPVLDELFMGVLAIDRNERIFYYNRFMGFLDDSTPEDMIGFKIQEVYSVKENESPTVEALRTGRSVLDRYMNYKTARGRQLASLNNAYPLYINGQVVASICLVLDVTSLLPYVSARRTIPALQPFETSEDRVEFSSLIGKNPLFREAVEVAKIAGNGPSPIMLVGETGTGKDLFSQAIHNYSPMSKGQYVPINCSAIPEPLLEGLLFGTTKGAFTGAEDRPGLFEHASGGTLFLDELSSMPLTLQAKLLRVIQDQKVRRVGGLTEKKVNARIISAVSAPPRNLVATDKLRPDLYFRLGVVQVTIPPLRDRLEDIPELTKFFVNKISKKLNREMIEVNSNVMQTLKNRPWPGNVRELEHVLESSLNFVLTGETLDLRHLKRASRHSESIISPIIAVINPEKTAENIRFNDNIAVTSNYSLKEDLLNFEKERIITFLQKYQGNITKTANRLGISQPLLIYKMKKFKLNRKMFDNIY